MVILRPTRKLQKLLPETLDTPAVSDTALGDWYVNRLVVDRQPLLLLVSSRSLLSILIPARDVRVLPGRLPELVADRLKHLGISSRLIDAEIGAMQPVSILKTVDRSVTGIMVDFAKSIPVFLEPNNWSESTLRFVESRLWENPCYAGKRSEDVIFPRTKTPELLVSQWHSD